MEKQFWVILERMKPSEQKINDFFDEIKDEEKQMYQFVFDKWLFSIIFVVNVETWSKDELKTLFARFQDSEDELEFNDYLNRIWSKFFVNKKEID